MSNDALRRQAERLLAFALKAREAGNLPLADELTARAMDLFTKPTVPSTCRTRDDQFRRRAPQYLRNSSNNSAAWSAKMTVKGSSSASAAVTHCGAAESLRTPQRRRR